MASKVPKFGAWEGGDNFTVYFDKARQTRTGGPRINPNDPEENPDLFRLNGFQAQAQAQAQAAPPQTRVDKQRKQTKVPHFGAWENEETAGYTVCFENVRKTRHGGPPVTENEPQMNRDMPHHPNPSPQTQTRNQNQAHDVVTTKLETKGGRPKVPEFGDWESEGGGGSYTMVFDNLKHKKHDHPKSNPPQPNRDVGPTPQEGRGKVPKFGDWEEGEGEGVQYTSYFEKAKQSKNMRPGAQNPSEPQMNRDVGDSASSMSGSERQSRPSSVAQAPVHPRANLQPHTRQNPRNEAASIPHFGGWNSDPSQAEGYTSAFAKAKDDRHTPVNYNAPPANKHRQPQPQPKPHSSKQKQHPGCCTIM
ncbi:hypothetical protein RND81_04G101900 [Saponaria officinalis]|uniref:RIN4 pathogenic type III effector avirulence factor Avr cleavage site domain-containing protein n=1 Tax=Saponaria officinalis TaxID=3572 RepID=A0AAW1LI47_SAPOF